MRILVTHWAWNQRSQPSHATMRPPAWPSQMQCRANGNLLNVWLRTLDAKWSRTSSGMNSYAAGSSTNTVVVVPRWANLARQDICNSAHFTGRLSYLWRTGCQMRRQTIRTRSLKSKHLVATFAIWDINVHEIQGGPKKTRPLCLTADIFKTYEPICVLFGRLQRYFVENTCVKSIMNRFITQVAPPGNKINNSVFHLQNYAKPLNWVHFCKILAPICLSDVSVVLLQNAYEMTPPFADPPCCVTFHHASLQIKPPTSTNFSAVMVFKMTTDGL